MSLSNRLEIDNFLKIKNKTDYLDLARELKNWNMKVTVTQVIYDALVMVTKKGHWRNSRSEEESKPFKPQNY